MSKEYLEALECLEEVIDNLDDYADFEIKQEANDCLETIKQALQRLESIDNANPSEALEVLGFMGGYIIPTASGNKYLKDFCDREFATIKQALLKAQEPKQYLKWEDLEFKEEEQTMKVLLNGNKYTLDYYSDGYDDYIDFLTDNEQDRIAIYEGGYPHDKQFFNDLHLERVEE